MVTKRDVVLLLSLALASFTTVCDAARSGEPTADNLELDPKVAIVQTTTVKADRQGHPLYSLGRKIREDEFGTPALVKFVETMRAIQDRAGGIGLAANQVGKKLQVFTIEAASLFSLDGRVPFAVYINPRILAASTKTRNFMHGCLSSKGSKRGNVATWEWVDIEARGVKGEKIRKNVTGFEAIIFQHEYRHLLGQNYLDFAKEFLGPTELEKAGPGVPHLLGDYTVGQSIEEHHAKSAGVQNKPKSRFKATYRRSLRNLQTE